MPRPAAVILSAAKDLTRSFVPMPHEMYRPHVIIRAITILVALACLTHAVAAMDRVTVRRDGREIEVEGRVIVTAQDGGILLLARDGLLWSILPEEKAHHSSDAAPFRPLGAKELSHALLAQLPKGFDVYQTTHYLICYDTSRAYAQWCGGLFERLYTAFRNYWTRKGFQLAEPEFPLVAIVFADRANYTRYAEGEAGSAASSMIGYFGLVTNHMTMVDLSGSAGRGNHLRTNAQINQVLSAPDAFMNVATVVHEATHQIAFNCGLHTRLSDCPLWFSEGIAVYFETPDLRSAKGWNGIGGVNRPRLAQFTQYLGRRGPDSLASLVANDKRFRDPKQALDAYAEAWALTYYLLRQHPKEYVAYLEMLAKKKALLMDDPKERVAQFEKAFGELRRVDADFLRFMGRTLGAR
jgi:hypothetical protein